MATSGIRVSTFEYTFFCQFVTIINNILFKVESIRNDSVDDTQISQMVKTVPVILPQVRKGKAFTEQVSLPEQNRIMQALVEVVGKVRAGTNEKYSYVDEETIALAEQLPLHFETTNKPFSESAESTTFSSIITSNIDTETIVTSTDATSEESREVTTVLETKPFLSILLSAPNKTKSEVVVQLPTTTASPVEEVTATILSVNENVPSLEKVTTESEILSSIDVGAKATTTTLTPFQELLNSHFEERLLSNKVSTLASDLSLAEVTTPMSSVTTDHSLLTSEYHLPKFEEIKTELQSSTGTSGSVSHETSTVATFTDTDGSLNILSTTTASASTNLHFNSAIESTTIKMKVHKNMNTNNENTFSEEMTTEHPTKQFIKELIALKERQLKLNTPSVQTTTLRSSDEGHTSTSVEFNTRRTISSHGTPLFLFLTTSTPFPQSKMMISSSSEIATTEPPLERENRKLPFAFYNTQGMSRAVDEGHFVSSFQDFYSDTNIFNGMMPAYVSQNDKITNNVEMNSLWFGNKVQDR